MSVRFVPPPTASGVRSRAFVLWLGVAVAVAVTAVVALALALGLGLARADRLLDRAARSQDQLAMVGRLDADAIALLADEAALRDEALAELPARVAAYRTSIAIETATLGDSPMQDREAARADALAALANRMHLRTGRALAADAHAFRAAVAPIAARERAEAVDALTAMRRLRHIATGIAIALPLALAILAGWFVSIATASLRRAEREVTAARRSLEGQVAARTAELAERNTRLTAIDRSRRRFFSQVGHELRTPVTVIRGEAEVGLRDPAATAERLRETLRHVVATGAFLGRRIDDLLTIARAEDGRLAIDRTPVDFAALAREVAAIATVYAADRRITVAIEADDPLPVRGDASWLQQALLGLVDNAVRHAGGHIVIRATRDAGHARVAVLDDGPGARPEDLPHLLDPWFSTAGGSGLGLAAARWVADAHDGTLTVSNRAEGGLAVVFALPLA